MYVNMLMIGYLYFIWYFYWYFVIVQSPPIYWCYRNINIRYKYIEHEMQWSLDYPLHSFLLINPRFFNGVGKFELWFDYDKFMGYIVGLWFWWCCLGFLVFFSLCCSLTGVFCHLHMTLGSLFAFILEEGISYRQAELESWGSRVVFEVYWLPFSVFSRL